MKPWAGGYLSPAHFFCTTLIKNISAFLYIDYTVLMAPQWLDGARWSGCVFLVCVCSLSLLVFYEI